MLPPVLAIALILYLVGDTVTRGKLTAIMKGTTKGAAKTTGRAAIQGAKRAHTEKLAYLDSGKAPLGRTRRRVGKAATGASRAAIQGARDGAREELARLREAIDAAREDAERARLEAQDPAVGVQRGRYGRSFDLAPRPPRVVATDEDPLGPWRETDPPVTARPTVPGPNPAPSPMPEPEPDDDRPGVRESDLAVGDCTHVLHHVREPGIRRPVRYCCGRVNCTEHDTDTTTDPEGNPTTMTATTNGGPTVSVNSVPGWLTAVDQLAQAGQTIHEAGIELGIQPQAQAGLQDAVDILRGIAQQNRVAFSPLVEAADVIPQGAEEVTVGKARTE